MLLVPFLVVSACGYDSLDEVGAARSALSESESERFAGALRSDDPAERLRGLQETANELVREAEAARGESRLDGDAIEDEHSRIAATAEIEARYRHIRAAERDYVEAEAEALQEWMRTWPPARPIENAEELDDELRRALEEAGVDYAGLEDRR